MLQNLNKALESIKINNLISIWPELVAEMNQTVQLLNKEVWDREDLENVYATLFISNILYNNSTMTVLPLEDGVYDMLVVRYNNLTNGKSPVGAPPVQVIYGADTVELQTIQEPQKIKAVSRIPEGIYNEYLFANSDPMYEFYDHTPLFEYTEKTKSRRTVSHKFPELVGTLDKCKFVLNRNAAERGLLYDDRVMIFERDFFAKIAPVVSNINLVATLKYDGVSIEAEVDGDMIVSARTRGDTDNDEATDLTPVFYGYRFPKAASQIMPGYVFGMKFECIITKENLIAIERDFGKKYVNARNAVIGLLSGLDARKYVKYLTLVPLRTGGLDIPDRLTEITLLNKYYSSGVDLKYTIISNGDYNQTLFEVYRFTKEAETMRPYMDFMYDGVVVEFIDPNIVNRLGRIGSVDKWCIAIKFNSMIKSTVFLGCSFSVGQNGVIIPMAHFNPVEFLGGIHNKTTMHSYSRFKNLGLKAGDIINVDYRNDVICYITKPDSDYNRNNPNPVIPFPEVCPCCGAPLRFSEDSAYCTNYNCPARLNKRISNMLQKLNFKDFGEVLLDNLGINSFVNLIEYDKQEAINKIGQTMGEKFMDRINELKCTPIYDYRLVGSLGFSSIAATKWKEILKNISLKSIINLDDHDLRALLNCIKGISDKTSTAIVRERPIFLKDLIAISNMGNVIFSYGNIDDKPQVRFTGFRDPALELAFEKAGYDADSTKAATKKTAILVIPYEGFTSSKLSKVNRNTCLIVTPIEAWKMLERR